MGEIVFDDEIQLRWMKSAVSSGWVDLISSEAKPKISSAKADFILASARIDPYLFNTLGEYSHGKEKLFKKWGYTADDAHWLQEEIEKQGRANYIAGNYTLGKLNAYGQRLNIRVEIPRKDGHGTVSFITGWTARPHGEIKLNTPYGGS